MTRQIEDTELGSLPLIDENMTPEDIEALEQEVEETITESTQG